MLSIPYTYSSRTAKHNTDNDIISSIYYKMHYGPQM